MSNPELPAGPCVVSPSGDPATSFLHLEQLSLEDKRRWMQASQKAGITLAEWVQAALNAAARRENPPKP